MTNNEQQAQVIDVEVTETIDAEDGLSATANFSTGTAEICEARAR